MARGESGGKMKGKKKEMNKKKYILDKTIVLNNEFDIYRRKGVNYFITRTTYNQIKKEKSIKNINVFLRKHNIYVIRYRHDFIDDNYSFCDLKFIDDNERKSYLYVLSNDSIIEKLNSIGIDHCDIQKLQNDISDKKIISNSFLFCILYWLKEAIKLIVQGMLIIIASISTLFLLFLYPSIINCTLVKIIIGILIIPTIIGLFILRKKKRCKYGLIEIIVGILAIASAIFQPTIDATTGITDVLKLFGGIYITIRGMDNFEKGLKSPYYIKCWEKFFGKRATKEDC